MNAKRPNKHFFSSARSFTFDDEKNDWKELSHNFYFLEEEGWEKPIILIQKMIKIFFTIQTNDNLADAKKLLSLTP